MDSSINYKPLRFKSNQVNLNEFTCAFLSIFLRFCPTEKTDNRTEITSRYVLIHRRKSKFEEDDVERRDTSLKGLIHFEIFIKGGVKSLNLYLINTT